VTSPWGVASICHSLCALSSGGNICNSSEPCIVLVVFVESVCGALLGLCVEHACDSVVHTSMLVTVLFI